jgi:WD40 repeat protein
MFSSKTNRIILIVFSFIFVLKGIGQEVEKILWTASWSPNDQYIAVGGADKILRLYDGKSFQLIRTDTLEEWINRLSWHPTKKILAIAASGDGSRLIDFKNDKTILLYGLHRAGSRAVSWSPDGKQLAIADYEGFVHIWKLDGTRVTSFKKENSKSYTAIDWHPYEDRLLVTGEKIREYDLDGNLIKMFFHRPDSILLLCVAWHPSGEFYAIGDYGNPGVPLSPLLQFYQKDHQLIWQNDQSKAEFRNIKWSPDGSRLATASDILRIWSSEGQLLFEGPEENDNLWGIDWNGDGSMIVTSSENGQIKIWNNRAELIKVLL